MKGPLKHLTLFIIFLGGCSSCNNQNDLVRKKLEDNISQWILDNADNPGSYLPGTFDNFEIVDYTDGKISEKYYRISHNYKLKSVTERVVDNYHHFALNKDFNVSIISNKNTQILQGTPPSIFDWAINFGEKFKKVDFGGLDSAYYFRKFKDYKNIGGNVWYDFNYLDSNCVNTFIQSLLEFPEDVLRIERIVKAIPEFNTNFANLGEGMNELGMEYHRIYGKNPQTNFVVFTTSKDTDEIFAVVDFKPETLSTRQKSYYIDI
jgi:hypothetical protein